MLGNPASEFAVSYIKLPGRAFLAPQPVVTEVVPAGTFYAAEDYHQQYFEKMGRTSCHAGLKTAATA